MLASPQGSAFSLVGRVVVGSLEVVVVADFLGLPMRNLGSSSNLHCKYYYKDYFEIEDYYPCNLTTCSSCCGHRVGSLDCLIHLHLLLTALLGEPVKN